MAERNLAEVGSSDEGLDLDLSRRDFLKLTGGVFVFFGLGDLPLGAQPLPTDFNAFLKIGEDGRVTCFTGKIEMGQGIVTSLAQMLADELDVSLDSVDMVMGDTDLCPWDRGTWGSLTTRRFGPPLRAACAEARQVLLELASERLSTPAEQLTVENGVVFSRANRKARVTYAQLTKGKQIERHLDEKAVVKHPSQFKAVGKATTRRDARVKVTGEAEYTADIQLPDMLYAKILRPPAHGAKLLSVDASAARDMQGVRVVEDGDFVAVLHRYPDEAERALATVKARYDTPESDLNEVSIFDHLLKAPSQERVVSQAGDLKTGESLASTVVEKTYLDGYVAHAPIEPHAAVARIEGDKVTVWASTQTPFGVRDQVAEFLEIAKEKVRVITPFVGGGFGGKSPSRQALEAVRLARLTGAPVQVAWNREEEFFFDTFRPAAVVKIRSGIGDQGRISFWDYSVYFAGNRGSDHFYDIPHYATVSYDSPRGGPRAHPFGTGAWRAPGNITNTFARESQIEVLASMAGVGALEFRLRHLKNERMRGALVAASEKFGWSAVKPPRGRGYGIACGTDVGTDVATIAEVEVDERSGEVEVQRVVCAQDMGLAINPAGATIQMEGCITMGLGYALTEDIHFRGGEILDRNFDTYDIPKFSWVPEIETVLVNGPDDTPQGGGEPAIITMGGAIANAVSSAIGARVYQLPITPERVREAIAARNG